MIFQSTMTTRQLACLATILGTKNSDVMILLSHPGAIEFTMMVFLVLDNFYSFTPETVPLYVLDVVRQTFGVLSQALPTELNAKLPLGRTDTVIRVPNGTSSLTAEMYRDIFRACMMNLWHFTREFNEPQNSVPLPSYVRAAFTNPEMTRRIREERDLAGPCDRTLCRGIGRKQACSRHQVTRCPDHSG
ncbi:hypothetical protein EDB83DRAFT_258953 [Lactarius deliciosus]|nr:hypothetical protein EDB83DRAFT_258953 [Lactarius deliciosus]